MKPEFEIAYIGLLGVGVGAVLTAGLTFFKDWWTAKRSIARDNTYLAIVVSSMLDMFVAGCAEVAGDDGLYHGQTNQDGYREVHTTSPTFEPLTVDVEWKSLPSRLMNDVLSFPLLIESAKSKIEAEYEYAASPPDFDEFFSERRYQFAMLGRSAFQMASELRKNASLPPRVSGTWDPMEYLQTQIDRHEKWLAELEARPALIPPLAL
jgi:hypothetical protein